MLEHTYEEGVEVGRALARIEGLEDHAKAVNGSVKEIADGLSKLVTVVSQMRSTQQLISRLVALTAAPIFVAYAVFRLTH